MTPLTTAIFDFHNVISALTTLLTTATATSVASENQPLRDSVYDFDSDSIASENQPIEGVPFAFYLSLFHPPLLFPPFFLAR